MVIEKGVHADIDELARLYDDLNDFLDSDINHPGWIKGVYPCLLYTSDAADE